MRLLALGLAASLLACGSAKSPLAAPTPVGYGVPSAGDPGWQERTVLALSNAMRMAPSDWKARWAAGELGSSLGSAYPAVPPLRWNEGLGLSSRSHSVDMGTNGCFQHASCNGTSWSARIEADYDLSSSIGENIAAGYSDPDSALFAWACDGSSGACAPDGNGDGHRANLMSAGWQALGVGYFALATSPYDWYWTQDFGAKADGPTPPLVDGSHDLVAGSTVRFFANYYDAAPPQSVDVNLDGTVLPLALALGAEGRGTYALEAASGTSCRSYFFVAVDAGGATWRYPASGTLHTYGEGGCTEDYSE